MMSVVDIINEVHVDPHRMKPQVRECNTFNTLLIYAFVIFSRSLGHVTLSRCPRMTAEQLHLQQPTSFFMSSFSAILHRDTRLPQLIFNLLLMEVQPSLNTAWMWRMRLR